MEDGGCLARLRAREAESLEAVALHLVPCCIAYNGPAEVSSFFRPRRTGIDADGIAVEEAAFRGRKLLGSTLKLPENYSGFVLEKGPQSTTWAAKSSFSQLTYWNHDVMPTNADAVRRCFDWLQISSAIHKPVSTSQVAAMIDEQGIVVETSKRRKVN